MDSRAGASTETIDATGGNLEAARKQAGHTNIKTTQRYSRGDLDSNLKVAVLRAAKREQVDK
jgi:integrase